MQSMSKEEQYLDIHGVSAMPDVEIGKKNGGSITFTRLGEKEAQLYSSLARLMGWNDVSEAYRVVIIWLFRESDFFLPYEIDSYYGIDFHIRRLEPYLLDQKQSTVVTLVDHIPEDGEKHEVAA